MKVLVLNGSPRKGGNTDILLEEAVKGAKEAGGSVIEHHLNSLSLTPCQQCSECDDSERCIINDDMQSVYSDIITADRIIVGSPIFFFTVSAQLKIVIDRCQPFWTQKYIHKKPVPEGPFGRKGLLILVGGMKQTEKNEGYHCAEIVVRAFFRTVNVSQHTTMVFDDIDEKGAIRKHPAALSDVHRAGKVLIDPSR